MSVGTIGQVFVHQSTSHATGRSGGDAGEYLSVVMTAAYAAAPRLYARTTRPHPGRPTGVRVVDPACSSASDKPLGPAVAAGAWRTGRRLDSSSGAVVPASPSRISRRTDRRYQSNASHESSAASRMDTPKM